MYASQHSASTTDEITSDDSGDYVRIRVDEKVGMRRSYSATLIRTGRSLSHSDIASLITPHIKKRKLPRFDPSYNKEANVGPPSARVPLSNNVAPSSWRRYLLPSLCLVAYGAGVATNVIFSNKLLAGAREVRTDCYLARDAISQVAQMVNQTSQEIIKVCTLLIARAT